MIMKYPLLFLIVLTLAGCGGGSSDDGNSNRTSLSGRIFVASNTATDDDVNDTRATEVSNNDVFSAQSIPNPVILGGYVNQAGTGPSGRLKTVGDQDDYFEVDLRAGQTVTLFIATQNIRNNDLDLALHKPHSDGTVSIINSSVGDGEIEMVVVPADGHYLIQVQAHTGFSNYILSIGQNLNLTSHGMQLSDDFIPGEVIVQFNPENSQRALSASTELSMQTQSFDTDRSMLFTFEPSLHTLATGRINFTTPEQRLKYQTLMKIKQLRRRSDISEASPNYRLRTLLTPDDDLYRYQWNHAMMNLPQAWDITVGNSSVIVAVVDSGVLLDHPDLQGNLVQGYDFIDNIRISGDGDGRDSNPDDPGDQLPGSSSFHGTHVAGTIAAVTNNNEGIAGISWLTKIMPLRIIGNGGEGNTYDIEQAMRFAAGLPNDSRTVPARRADIINLSIGGPTISFGFQELVTEVRNLGIIVVAAAGNENTDIPIYPASLDGVISVSAVDINGQKASYSNFGNSIDVAAPGGDNTPDINGDGMPDGILSTIGEKVSRQIGLQKIEFTYSHADGTSMAAPHIAGVISLMKAVNPALTPADFDRLLRNGEITEDLGRQGRDDNYGHGLINAQKAVLAAAELGGNVAPQPAPILIVNPKSLNFGLNRVSAMLTLSNGGSGDLRIENIQDDSGGFLSYEGNGLGNYTIKVNRNRLGLGTFTATITFISNTNVVRVPVILQVGDPDITGDAGFHYILLVEPESLETIQQKQASVTDGVYNFRFDDVPKGTYIIAAGSDFNNDGYICDDGEACGTFTTVERPTPIEVTGRRSNIDFNTGFYMSFLSTSSIADVKVPNRPARGFARLKPQKSVISNQ